VSDPLYEYEPQIQPWEPPETTPSGLGQRILLLVLSPVLFLAPIAVFWGIFIDIDFPRGVTLANGLAKDFVPFTKVVLVLINLSMAGTFWAGALGTIFYAFKRTKESGNAGDVQTNAGDVQTLRTSDHPPGALNATDDKVPCSKCGKPIFRRMAALSNGLCSTCKGVPSAFESRSTSVRS
jgi:hypothetical protein